MCLKENNTVISEANATLQTDLDGVNDKIFQQLKEIERLKLITAHQLSTDFWTYG